MIYWASHLLVARPTVSRALEVFVVEAASRSTHVAMIVCPLTSRLLLLEFRLFDRPCGSCRPLCTTLPCLATRPLFLSASVFSTNATRLYSIIYPVLLPLPTPLLTPLTPLSLGESSHTVHNPL